MRKRPRIPIRRRSIINLGCLISLLCGCAAPPETTSTDAPAPDYGAIGAELIAMGEADQEVRGRLIEWMKTHPGENPPGEIAGEMTTLDRAQAARVKEIIDEVGWPTNSMVGEEAASNAWLIIQHAVHDPPLMQRALDLMTPLLGTGEIRDQDYALLYDRVNMLQGKPQRYGTQGAQLVIDGVKHHGLYPIEDVEHVDARRAEIGMSPVADYLNLLREAYGVPDEEPNFPIDMSLDEYNAILAEMRAARKDASP